MSSRIRYFRLFTFLFNYKEWGNRLLMGSLMMLIPVVGPIIIQGWGVEMMHRRIRGEEGLPELNDIGALLKTGLVPFLVGLIAMMPIMMVMMVVFFIAMFAMGALQAALISAMGEDGVAIAGIVSIVGMILMMFLSVLLSMLVSVPIQAMQIRVDLTGKFESAFQFAEVIAMTKKMFKPMMLGSLFISFFAPIAVLVGYAMCLIGVYPAIFICTMAGYELRTQIYRAYLAEGGTPLAEVSFIDNKPLTLGPEV